MKKIKPAANTLSSSVQQHPSFQAKGSKITETRQHIRVAPLPHPSELEEYEKIKPGFAERIFVMAENQASHRQNLEQKTLDASNDHLKRRDAEARWGQGFAFIIVLATVVCGYYAARMGAQLFGSFIAGLGICSIAYIFVKGREK